MKSGSFQATSWLIGIAAALALVGAGLRVVLAPAFPRLEYRRPGFPPDPYGFTTAERVRWSAITWDYLINDEDASFLADLRFDDGRPVYGPREVAHMRDVKAVVRTALRVWYGALGALATIGLIAWRRGGLELFKHGLAVGGWIVVGLAGAIVLTVLIGILFSPDLFWGFFSGFHAVFFEGDSWLFLYSDTLIRLFPIRFWQDAFLLAAVLAVGGGLALGKTFQT